MKKTTILIIILSIIIIVSIITIFSLNKNTSLSPKNLEKCNTLAYNGKDKINLVFFSSEEQAKKYSDFLLTIPPFNKNQFNFYYIDSYKPECELYKDIAILCYSKELIKKASSCPNDYIIVLEEKPKNIRSSAYMNVMSLNSNHQLTVFPHEFGHALANFADEYTPAKLPKSSQNCVADCKSFDEFSEECFQGCSKSNYYRSVDNGIMRTLNSNTYGKFDELLIQEKINKNTNKLTGLAIDSKTDCSKEKYYLIEGNLNNDEITILEKSIEQGCSGENGAGNFDYNLILEDSTNYNGEFNPELIFTDAQEETQEYIKGEIFDSNINFLLKIPFIENSKTLEINKDDQLISQINLQDADAQPCKTK